MVGRGLLTFKTMPSIAATGVTAGPLEKKSPFVDQFDKVYDDERCGMKTNEHAQAKMMEDACMIALSKVDSVPSDADFLLIGDLVNQMTPSNFSALQRWEFRILACFRLVPHQSLPLLMAAY